MDTSQATIGSVSSSVAEKSQDDDVTVTDYSHSGDDISTPTDNNMPTVVPGWTDRSIGHKRSRSNTTDYSQLTSSSTSTTATNAATVRHRRSSSLDINLLLYKNTNKPLVTEADNDSPLTISVKDVEQEEEQQQKEQPQPATLHPLQDEVDLSSMFGKWKGKQMTSE